MAPISFSSLQEKPMVVTTAKRKDITEAESHELHNMLALQKWTPYGRSLINAAIAELEDATHVFWLSEAEQRVVNCETSSFVLGRSGTGKTSCALFRLIGLEESMKAEPAKFRQLFITKSAVLASKIKDYYLRLRQTLDASELSAKDMQELRKEKEQLQSIDLVDEDDVRRSLPAKWSDLDDSHFPLFLSFDHFCSLIEADLGISRLQAGSAEAERRRATKIMSQKTADVKEVTEAFLLDVDNRETTPGGTALDRSAWAHVVDAQSYALYYHPHFDTRLTHNLDPLLCYSEFVAVIQGGLESLQTEKGFLSREEYLGLSQRTRGNFAHIRDRIYDLYLRYRELKAERGDWDAADRTHAIIRALKSTGKLKAIDCLFVDEAQDQLLIDTHLLRQIVSNPMGHFWAGDTAQTISASSFRFQDLSAAFYQAEQDDALVQAGKRASVQPAMFNLLVNYRSHRGITNVAAELVAILSNLFPNAIDPLGREHGIVDGTLPIIFDGFTQTNDLRVESFLFGAGDTTMEFGAEQCIIVRDEKARTELRSMLGDDFGLILTIYESKGLEFSDVLLYSFFSDSTTSENTWRVVLNLLDDPKISRPKFELTKHSSLMNELRNLYVAVTRARNRLWIFDMSSKIEPLKLFLKRKGLVELCRPGDALPEMAVSSTPAQWVSLAKSLFDKALYKQAANCYGRAGRPHEATIALAYQQRERAREARRSEKTSREIVQEFGKAADMFDSVAAEATSTNAIKVYQLAAQAHIAANAPQKAAASYELARDWTSAAVLYRKSSCFDESMRVLRAHAPEEYEWLSGGEKAQGGAIDVKEAELIVQLSRTHYVRKNQLTKARGLFESDEDELEWLDDYGFDTSALAVLESLGQHVRCAKIYLEQKDLLHAARAYQKAEKYQEAVDCLKKHLLRIAPLGTQVADASRDVQSTLRSTVKQLDAAIAAGNLEDDLLTQTYRRIVDPKLLYGELLKTGGDMPTLQEFFLLDFALQRAVTLAALLPASLQLRNRSIVRYARFLQPICSSRIVPEGMLELMGLERMESDGHVPLEASRWQVSLASPLYSRLPTDAEASAAGPAVGYQSLPQLLSEFFSFRLFDLVKVHGDQALDLAPLKPLCFQFTVEGSCERQSTGDCARQHNTESTETLFESRLSLLNMFLPLCKQLAWLATRLQQRSYETSECNRIRCGLLDAYGHVLFPGSPSMGSHAILIRKPELMDEATRATLAAESLDALAALDFRTPPPKFLNQMFLYSLVATFASPMRYGIEFPTMKAIRRMGTPELLLQSPTSSAEKRPVGTALFSSLASLHNGQRLSIDVLDRGVAFLEAILMAGMQIDWNALNAFIELLTIYAILASRKKNTTRSGFSHLILPENLARQAVFHFEMVEMQFFTPPWRRLVDSLADIATKLINNDNRFRMDGKEILYSSRPAVTSRVLRLMVLMGYNYTQSFTRESARAHVLNCVQAIASAYKARLQAGGRGENRLPYHVADFLDPPNPAWSSMHNALLRSNFRYDDAGRLVELVIGSQRPFTANRNILRISATTLRNLALRWTGMPEIPSALDAPDVKASTIKSILVPSQVSDRGVTKAAGLLPSAHQPAPTTGVDATVESPLNDQPTAALEPEQLLETDNQADTAIPEEEAGEAIALVDFEPVAEVDDSSALTEIRKESARKMFYAWKRKKIRTANEKWKSGTAHLHMLEVLAIIKKIPQSTFRYYYLQLLLNDFQHIKAAVDLAVKESEFTKRKVTKRLLEDHIDLESQHKKTTEIINLRKKLLATAKNLLAIVPSGDLTRLRAELAIVRECMTGLYCHPGNDAARADFEKAWERGSGMLADKPIAPTAKKPRRPALNTDESLDDDATQEEGDHSD